ncbi:MAG: beta-ketoacyl-[acyl-carrier-protein] synthase family protein, partial [Desulfovibrionales bacterium]|nr:beta-ketoacyl-[acyl-carrier-protein] synthase family protein [Desulfovibrionales bacterium]
MPKPKTAVTGTGCISALGLSLDACMGQMKAETRHPEPPREFSTNHPEPYPVFNLPKGSFEDLDKRVSPGNRGISPTALMGVEATRQALAAAGLSPENLKNKKVGVCMGTTVGCTLNNDPFYIQYREGGQPDLAPVERFLRSNPAEAIAREFDLKGPIQTIANACASGSDAIGVGAGWIQAGLCDLVIAGGTDELCRVTYNGFASLMITDPDPCRPFDASRRGLNLGEGAGILILEPLGAKSSKRSICRMAGYGSACDAHHLTAPRPDGKGLMAAMDQALDLAGLTGEAIDFINAHGTGTPDNDKVEMMVFKEKFPHTPFFSTKGYTGHTLGAAGAIEAVFTIDHLTRGWIPKSLGFETQDPVGALSPTTCAQTLKAT